MWPIHSGIIMLRGWIYTGPNCTYLKLVNSILWHISFTELFLGSPLAFSWEGNHEVSNEKQNKNFLLSRTFFSPKQNSTIILNSCVSHLWYWQHACVHKTMFCTGPDPMPYLRESPDSNITHAASLLLFLYWVMKLEQFTSLLNLHPADLRSVHVIFPLLCDVMVQIRVTVRQHSRAFLAAHAVRVLSGEWTQHKYWESKLAKQSCQFLSPLSSVI